MNRLLKLVVFIVFAAAFSITALAQDVLPVPEYSAEATVIGNIATYGPANNGEISVMSPLMWENIGAITYNIKFKIISTGQVITWKPQFMCAPQCMNYEYPMPLFNAVRDGEKVKWWVTATVDGAPYKSVKMTAFVNEVDAPFSLSPSGNNIIARDNIDRLMWNMSDLTVDYKLVVKNANTGSVVLKRTLNSNDVCDSTDDLCAFVFGGANPAVDSIFNHNTPYKWFVVATGVSGEKAKSPVARFSTAAGTN
jgi:hypothetical protein